MAAHDDKLKRTSSHGDFLPPGPNRSQADPTAIQETHLLKEKPERSGKRETFLIGTQFSAPKSTPWLGLCFAVLGAISALPLSFEPAPWWWLPAIPAGLFGLLAVICFVFRPAWRIRFTDRGVETFHPRQTLEYREIMQVYAPDRDAAAGKSFDIFLLHAYGVLRIPKTIQGDCQRVFDYLNSQFLAERENPPVPAIVQYTLTCVMNAHGRDKVFVYRTHLKLKKLSSNPWLENIAGWTGGIGFAVLMLIVIIDTTNLPRKPGVPRPTWLMILSAPFMLGTILGGIAYVAFCFNRWLVEFRSLFERAETVLIVSPGGLTVRRGLKEISLSWSQLQQDTNVGLSIEDEPSRSTAIRIWKGKKRIHVHDTLHWPLRHAIEQIRNYSGSGR